MPACKHCGETDGRRLKDYPRLGEHPAYKACANAWECYKRAWRTYTIARTRAKENA